MSDMKCPFCKKELKLIGEKSDSGYPIDEYVCSCPETAFCFGNTVMWNELRVLHEKLEERREQCELAKKELIRTRKAFDITVNALKKLEEKAYLTEYAQGVVAKALKESKTALEQKDVK